MEANIYLLPENVMDIQRTIGGDIIMAFDECPPGGSEYNYAKTSMELNTSLARQVFYSIQCYGTEIWLHTKFISHCTGWYVQRSAKSNPVNILHSKNATGNAIGGLSVGEPEPVMYEICDWCCDHLPTDKPRYLMGVGTPWNILECISMGIDMFDCVMPTRNGRNAMLFTTKGVINIDNKKWENDFSPH